jgi:uncharacterized protein YjbJ (UPF0337 family)
LTDDDLKVIAGKKDQLIGKLRTYYGYSKDRAEAELDKFLGRKPKDDCGSCEKDSSLN